MRGSGVFCAGRGNLGQVPHDLLIARHYQVMDLSHNAIEKLPSDFSYWSGVQELFLNNNQIEAVPDSIDQLTSLRTLQLSFNKISDLPVTIGQLSSLQQLHMSHNHLSSIPHSLGLLFRLTVLNVSNNNLDSLPESIGYLTDLITLQLASNQLTTLPDSIGKLKKLTTLNVSWNHLQSLPDTLLLLTKLEDVRLGHNHLADLPPHLTTLPRLLVLDVSSNPLSADSQALVQRFTSRETGTHRFRLCSLHSADVHTASADTWRRGAVSKAGPAPAQSPVDSLAGRLAGSPLRRAEFALPIPPLRSLDAGGRDASEPWGTRALSDSAALRSTSSSGFSPRLGPQRVDVLGSLSGTLPSLRTEPASDDTRTSLSGALARISELERSRDAHRDDAQRSKSIAQVRKQQARCGMGL
jgi:Leucine-rich repeat (LRR) protein